MSFEASSEAGGGRGSAAERYQDPAFRQQVQRVYADTAYEHDPDMEARDALLADFGGDPADEGVWNRAYAEAVKEEAEDANGYSEFQDIPAAALIELSRRVRSIPGFRERYRVMAETAPNGALWYEALSGFSSPDVARTIDEYLALDLAEQGRARHGTGLDLGCATGKVSTVLARHCERTIGIDASDALLAVARRISGDRVGYVQADVTHLPIADKSVDVITATGITGALDAARLTDFYYEAARILTDGGQLITGYYGIEMPSGGRIASPQDILIILSWKNTLADMIVDTVSGKFSVEDRLDDSDKERLMRWLGMASTMFVNGYWKNDAPATLEVYHKDNKKLAEQYRLLRDAGLSLD